MDLILYLLTTYKYHLLFPLAIVEGPILSVISGFLSSTGFLNTFLTYIIIVAGDVVGDTLYYLLGRLGNRPILIKITRWVGITTERSEKIKIYIENNPYKTISLSKIILGVGVTGLFLAGKSRYPFIKFFLICLCTSMLVCGGYFLLGFFFGKAYAQINNYLNYFSSLSLVTAVGIVIYLGIRARLKRKM